MEKPKLIALDIDGVVAIKAGEKRTVSLPLIKVLKQLQTIGVYCTFITGRGYRRVRSIIGRKFVPNCPMVLENGGRVTYWSGQDLARWQIPYSDLCKLSPVLSAEYARGVDFYRPDHKYCGLVLDESYRPQMGTGFLPKSHVDKVFDDPDAFIAYAGQHGCNNIVLLKVEDRQVPIPEGVNWVRNDANIIVNKQGVSKGSGLKYLIHHFSFRNHQVWIAGDDNNDVDMFSVPVGKRIAVGDCPAKLKRLATDIVESPDALADFLKQFI